MGDELLFGDSELGSFAKGVGFRTEQKDLLLTSALGHPMAL